MGRVAVAVIVSSWVIPISILVNRIVTDPYMDEIFHIPQAQQYCMGNFRSWDPMITTPPGLYLLSLPHLALIFPSMICMKAASLFSDVCSTAILRSTNGVLAVICSILVYEIIRCLRPTLEERKATFYAVVLSLYPLHWFFTFLYYTDVASLTAVLAMYFMSLKKNYLCSALLGAIAVILRQTNIIWVLFVACTGVLDCTMTHQKDVRLDESGLSNEKNGQSASDKGGPKNSNLRKRRFDYSVDSFNQYIPRKRTNSAANSSGLFYETQAILLTSWELKWKLLGHVSPFLILLVTFSAFVCWNGSIVLGAKEAHTVSPHFAQLLYFGLLSALFMAPVHFTSSQSAVLAQSFWKNKLLSFFLLFAALTAGFLSVHFFSIAHPYLLADNRHYPFYLWRKVIKVHWSMKYLLVPVYVYSWFSITNVLAKAQMKIWVLAYFLATAAALIPTPLIEFRYYTVPFFLIILHSHVNDDRRWLLIGILYASINMFTMILFLFRPFQWEHEAGIQRFIW